VCFSTLTCFLVKQQLTFQPANEAEIMNKTQRTQHEQLNNKHNSVSKIVKSVTEDQRESACHKSRETMKSGK
jgi:hypothetical protein